MSAPAKSQPEVPAGSTNPAFGAIAPLVANYPLKAHNTFGFDVRAHYACVIEHEEQLLAAVRDPRVAGLPCLVLGGGSNVVLSGDFAGLVLLVALRGRRVVREDQDAWYVEAAGGEPWHDFVAWTLAQGLPGLENLALIPGTVGAAPIQNIGAYGLEICERFASLRAIELATGERVEFDAQACRFGYRDSIFKREGRERFVITSVTFRLPKAWQPRAGYADLARELVARGYAATVGQADGVSGISGVSDTAKQPAAHAIFEAVVAVRRAKLPDPLELGNAGSFFKNPVIDARQFDALKHREPDVVSYPQPGGRVKLAAGWLIDRCGWKGRAIGAAGVHERQALVLVNRGGASGAQVLALAEAIQRDVLEKFGVELEAEPVCL